MQFPSTLFVSEIFQSIQGEGPKLGTPSIFLRLGMCNLQCTWCDTPYTWKKGRMDYKELSVEEVLKKIQALRKPALSGGESKIKNLVITGGEPLLQQLILLTLLKDLDMEVEFETNGSAKLLPEMLTLSEERKISFNISPKLKDSGNKPYAVQTYPNAVFKFVYVSKESEALILDFLKTKSPLKTYIMPEGTSVQKMEEKLADVLAFCSKNGFNFTPRLHIYLFGNKRGK